jgi:hypothetical protein
MTAIDKILLQLLSNSDEHLLSIPSRDLKVLKSLAKIVSSPTFITENQGRLLVKILKENFEKFTDMKDEILASSETPCWSKPFRQIDKTKKLYIAQSDSSLNVEFAFSSSIRKMLSANAKHISGFFQHSTGKHYKADLTERNIVALVELLEPLDFDIDQKIMDFYKIIKSWSETEIRSQFLIGNIDHTNFQKQITADLGIDTCIDENIILDRSVRYQYFFEKPKKTEKNTKNLVETIASRTSTKLWVDRKTTSLDEVLSSLLKLKRFPLLVIFDNNDDKRCLEDLRNLHENLEKIGIYNNVGIYFRLPNNEVGTQFNKFIAEHQYNYQLDDSTRVVGVQNGKIPKFFLKNSWRPMSVIAIGNSLRQTKTAVYANSCDLVITYTDNQPIIESRIIWE